MKRETFENYLQGVHDEGYAGASDMVVEAFESWYEDLGLETLVQYSDEFALKQYNLGVSDTMKKLEEESKDIVALDLHREKLLKDNPF